MPIRGIILKLLNFVNAQLQNQKEKEKKKENGSTIPISYLEGPENNKSKDMTGFQFESVETKKSPWQMYKALLRVRHPTNCSFCISSSTIFLQIRFFRFIREPVAIFIQVIMPLLCVIAAMYITGTTANNPSVVSDNQPLKLDAESLYGSGMLLTNLTL